MKGIPLEKFMRPQLKYRNLKRNIAKLTIEEIDAELQKIKEKQQRLEAYEEL
jgi:hypothetical protein